MAEGDDQRADEEQLNASAYGRALFEYFVRRRGRGTDLSSQDVALLLRWEEDGVPEPWVVEGIDAAFAKLREAPASISECRRHVLKVVEKRREDAAPVAAESGVPAQALDDEPAPIRVLRSLCRHDRSEVAAAATQLLEAVMAQSEEARVSFAVLGALDGQLEASVMAALPASEQAAVEEETEQMLRRERRAPDASSRRRARTRAYRALLGVPPLT